MSRVEILRVEPIPGGVQVFVRAWDENGKPLGFGADGSCEIERIRIFGPRNAVPDSTGSIVRVDQDGVERRFRDDPDAALRVEVERVVRLVGKRGTKVVTGKTANTTTVVYPAAGAVSPVDGRLSIGGLNATFATIRASSGNASEESGTDDNITLTASATTDQFAAFRRLVFGFDTSGIPDTDNISAATFGLTALTLKEVGLGDTGLCLTTFTPSDPAALADTDLAVANFGSTELATRIPITASWNTSAVNTFTLNASGLAAINVTGNTFFGLRLGWDFDNAFGGTWASGAATRVNLCFADTALTTSDPVLTITHAAAGGATSGAGVNRGLINGGTNAGINAGLIRRSMAKLNEWVERKSGLLVPKDSRVVIPVGIQLRGA